MRCDVCFRCSVHGVAIRDEDTDPLVVGNHIGASGQNGVFVYANGGGTVRENDVSRSGNVSKTND